MKKKELSRLGSPRRPNRDKPKETEPAKKVSARRESDRARQAKHREKLRDEEGSLGLEGLMTSGDRARSKAFGNELARLATEYRGYGELREDRPKVLALRERCLGGKTLSLRAARHFLATPSVYLMSVEDFRREGVPITARVTTKEGLPPFLKAGVIEHSWRLTLHWEGQFKTIIAKSEHRPGNPAYPDLSHPTPWGDIWGHYRRAAPGSVMDELLHLARELVQAYLWSQEHALEFILSGRAPEAAAIHISSEAPEWVGRDHIQGRLIISAQPWVSPKTITDIYRMFQKHYLASSNRRVSRPPHEDSIAFFDFVSERWHAGRSWRQMCSDWSEAHPDQAYAPDDIRNFQRAFKQIYKLMMGVDVRVTGGKPGRPKGSRKTKRPGLKP